MKKECVCQTVQLPAWWEKSREACHESRGLQCGSALEALRGLTLTMVGDAELKQGVGQNMLWLSVLKHAL